MKRKLVIMLSTVILLAARCNPHVDDYAIPTEDLYAVTCFISPSDTSHVVWLYRASALGDVANPEKSIERNALVTISDGHNVDTLQINDDDVYYHSLSKSVKVLENRSYTLSVYLKGHATITAECSVPPTPPAPEIDGQPVNEDFNFVINWNNPKLHRYFVVSASAKGTYVRNGPFGPIELELNANLNQRSFPSDNQLLNNHAAGNVPYAMTSDSASLTAQIWNIDENFLNYYQTFDQYDAWITSARELIPLFNQPRPIYSNMRNAVGIFAAFNTSKKTVIIKEPE